MLALRRLTSRRIPLITRSITTSSTSNRLIGSEKLPDVSAFLTKIGRNCTEYTETYENQWDNLLKWDGKMLKEKGIPVRQRKYILNQVENLRQEKMDCIREIKLGKKSFFGGERNRKAFKAKWEAEQRNNNKK
ncbi:mitochondrial 37S ribosomal protein mS41 NDAI_0D01730 [Naumovozyma dairenensis CBS 421]|uniref:Small ribosomal subunit protein mS41 n=1 Tax=Naumovozyma dairenensis (strain ATCC 10597 / BCRC 20456 / CBS 421 / NBRC 0211 / NRRL Y-12639) TaxID=1071378 RepID=G0W9M6_NAUDC|nr:hypothetical protein NDAI_0D01730 [Naumovozyma dairenensis CBS 421]CCD24487.1 hypothetical protein NDAI_0D01730 [Naumovozyma dairenensis CBS 421]